MSTEEGQVISCHTIEQWNEQLAKGNESKKLLCILVAGALGGRFDHEIGNINVLCSFSNTRIVLLSEDCLIQLLPRSHHHEIHILSSVKGPHCGLIPIAMPSASTTTTGLQWDLILVSIHCECCKKKVKKVLHCIDGGDINCNQSSTWYDSGSARS